MIRSLRGTNSVTVTCESDAFIRDGRKIARALDAALFFEKKKNFSCAVHLVLNSSMRRINLKTRGKDFATNVLSFEASHSFPHPESPKNSAWHGEIFLAPRVITAKNEDVVFLAIHGLLHLLGYTHEKKSARMVMEAREREIVRFISRPAEK